MPDEHVPLIADQSRQAQDALRGYAYQIWHSLLAWLTLKDDQVLILEGAEDFDILEGDSATSVQVKDTRRRLTLRSEIVLVGLCNFLETSRRNRPREVHYRLLTTAIVTVERKSPFGRGVAGLDLWEAAARRGDKEAAARIRDFLLQIEIPEPLRVFLINASPSAVLVELIEKVRWNTGSLEIGLVERAVNEALISLGDHHGFPPTESRRVVGRLLRETLRQATSKESQYLSRALLLEIFEEETTERVPFAQLSALRRAQETLTTSFLKFVEGSGPALVGGYGAEPIAKSVPPLGFDPLPRPKLIEEGARVLDEIGALILTGGTGTGKSLLARALVLQAGYPAVWAPFSFGTVSLDLLVLQRIREDKGRETGRRIYVMDNLDLHQNRDYADRAGALIFELVNAGHHVVVTSLRSAPPDIIRRLGSLAPRELRVPHFAQDEIKVFLGRSGCAKELTSAWAKVIETKTSGHPQLVHAYIENLSRRRWPPPTPDDLVREPETLERERLDARTKLVQQISPSERALVYALSLYAGPFRRPHALAVGGLAEVGLERPGESFDPLVGPWVEQVNRDYYSLSPLLRGAASAAWAPEKVARLQAAIGMAVLDAGAAGLLEAGSALLLGLAARADELTTRVCLGLLQAPQEHMKRVAEAVDWLSHMELPPASFSPASLCFLRVLQYRVAAAVHPSRCRSIIQAWRSDIAEIEDEVMSTFHRFSLAGEVLVRSSAEVSPDEVLSCLLDLHRLRGEAPEPIRSMATSAAGASAVPKVEWPLDLPNGFILVAEHCRDAENVLNLLRSLRALEERTRNQLLIEHRRPPFGGALFVSLAWTSEAKRDNPSWKKVTATLLAAILYGNRWKAKNIALAGYNGLAAVSAEYLENETAALKVLDRANRRLGPEPAIAHQRASVYFAFSKHKEALEIWDGFLMAWNPDTFPEREYSVAPTLACRMAGISAAKTERWRRAAKWFEEGARRAALTLHPRFSAGFEADAAYCYWCGGLFQEYIYAALRSVQSLESLRDSGDIATRVTSKLISHTLLYMWTGGVDGVEQSGTAEPVPGMNSNPDVNEEVATLRASPIELNWLILVEAENKYLGESAVFRLAEPLLRETPYSLIRSRFLQVAMDQAIRSGCPAGLARLAQKIADLFVPAATVAASPDPLALADGAGRQDQVNSLPFSLDFLAACLLRIKASDLTQVLQDWKVESSELGAAAGFVSWLETVEQMRMMSLGVLRSNMLDGALDRDRRLIAATLLGSEVVLDPETRFAAHLLLYFAFREGPWKNGVGDVLAGLITVQWRAHADAPATLLAPQLTVPLLRNATADSSRSWVKVARVLLSASGAVRLPLTQEQRVELRRESSSHGP